MSVCVGDHIPYVVCEGMDSSAAMRAEFPTTVTKSGGTIKLDIEWYLSQQILPPISRLCAPIEGTDVQQLASALYFFCFLCGPMNSELLLLQIVLAWMALLIKSIQEISP